MKRTWAAGAALLITVAAGCSTPEIRNSYEGPDRAGTEVAVLFTSKADAYADKRPRAFFSAVDGKHYGTTMMGLPGAARVLPGDVLIKVNCFDPQLWASPEFPDTFGR
jgi:hypothetical protein